MLARPRPSSSSTLSPPSALPGRIASKLRRSLRSPAMRKFSQELLLELCRIDTTPRSDPARMKTAEDACFKILERELGNLRFPAARTDRRPIDPAIQNHPSYSLLHFTRTTDRPQGLSAEKCYADRSNLVYWAPGTGRGRGRSVALNAHLDVVAPFLPPRAKDGVIYGRGACDDKGPVVAIVTALKALSQVMTEASLNWKRNVLAMFVVEEETGGNGSLSLALDRELKRGYDSIVVCECTGLKVHPGNRGAVWYRAELTPPSGTSALEMFAFVNEELEKEGVAIRAESAHPLFPQRPVQTCHGILGTFGAHPSRVCAEASFQVQFPNRPRRDPEALVRDCLEIGLASYTGLYGDKTIMDPAHPNRPRLSSHYDVRTSGKSLEVDVHGIAGHMGAIRDCDGAITKLAHLVRSLTFSKARIELVAGTPMQLCLPGTAETLVLEGGQGFVPTHSMDEIMNRLRQAVERGAENYLRRVGRPEAGADVTQVAYEKLHNEAFAGPPDSLSMRNALAVARKAGLPRQTPVLGWTVSCDARLFASEYPGMDVLTFGPGHLVHAHSDQEQIQLEDVRKAAEFLALFLLRQTGTLSSQVS